MCSVNMEEAGQHAFVILCIAVLRSRTVDYLAFLCVITVSDDSVML